MDMEASAYREAEMRKAEFFSFLDKELAKIGSFYKEKEDEATHRLLVLRDQLRFMREQRIEEITSAKENSAKQKNYGTRILRGPHSKVKKYPQTQGVPRHHSGNDTQQDYGRHQSSAEVSYRTAKRELEKALAEYYRGLELMRSYSLLNRKAFQKITKKHDKVIQGYIKGQYMAEKVDPAYFVRSDVVQSHMRTVEDVYARYFERGNRKIAAGKLRAKPRESKDHSACLFRSGVLLATGLLFGIQGLSRAVLLLSDPDPVLAMETNYLLQVRSSSMLTWHTMLRLRLDLCWIWPAPFTRTSLSTQLRNLDCEQNQLRFYF